MNPLPSPIFTQAVNPTTGGPRGFGTPSVPGRRRARAFGSAAGEAGAGETAGGGILHERPRRVTRRYWWCLSTVDHSCPASSCPCTVTDERLIAEVEEMKDRGQAYVGTFLRKSEEAAEEGVRESGANWDPSDDMHDMGTFAQVQNIIRIPDVGDALKEGKEEGGKKNGIRTRTPAAAHAAPPRASSSAEDAHSANGSDGSAGRAPQGIPCAERGR